MLWLISLAEYFRLRFRLMFHICMHCLHFPGIWMLVPFPRNPTLISKIIMGLVTIRDMNLCIKCIGLPHWPAIVLLCPVCVCVMSGCHGKLQRKTFKSRPSFFACSILSRMFNVTNEKCMLKIFRFFVFYLCFYLFSVFCIFAYCAVLVVVA